MAAELLARLAAGGWSMATSESLTGGLLAAELTAVPGASAVFRGGVVAYATETKVKVLGVAPETVAKYSVVSSQVASEMARGVQRLFQADLGLSTTGVAGPEPLVGHPVGEVWLGCAFGDLVETQRLALSGSRAKIRQDAVRAALNLATRVILAWK